MELWGAGEQAPEAQGFRPGGERAPQKARPLPALSPRRQAVLLRRLSPAAGVQVQETAVPPMGAKLPEAWLAPEAPIQSATAPRQRELSAAAGAASRAKGAEAAGGA